MAAEPAYLPGPGADFDAHVEAVMHATQRLVAITAQAMADVEDVVTLPQFRVLVMVATAGSLNLRSVAAELKVHPSNATRTCDRLVSGGLLSRRENPEDRRQSLLTLTDAGRRLIDSVLDRRRTAIGEVLARLPEERRAGLAAHLDAFTEAADRPHDAVDGTS